MTADDPQDIDYEEHAGYYVEEYHESPRGSFTVLSGRFKRVMHRTQMQWGAIVMRSAEALHLRRVHDGEYDDAPASAQSQGRWRQIVNRTHMQWDAFVARSAEVLHLRRGSCERDDNASYGFDAPAPQPARWERLKHQAQSRCGAVAARSAEVLHLRREHDDGQDNATYGFDVPALPPGRWARMRHQARARWVAADTLTEEWLNRRDNTDDEGDTASGGATGHNRRASFGVILLAIALLAGRRCTAHVATCGGFARDWLQSRHISALLWGLPALFAAVACCELVWSGYRDREAAAPLILEYKIAAQQALEAGRLREAEVLLRKVLTLDASNIDGTFGLGLIASKQGNRDTARRLMQRIAPLDRDGDPRARHWLAAELMAGLSSLSSDERHALEQHLQRLKGERTFDRDASVMLGQYYLSRQQFDRAAENISEACRWHPELFLLLAQLRAATGGPAPADSDLERARDVFRGQTQDNAGNVEAWLKWAETEKLLKEYSNAEQILLAGLQRTSHGSLREGLVALYVSRFDAMRNGRETSETRDIEALEFLERAIRFGPHSAAALKRLADVTADSGGQSDVVRAAANQAIAIGKAPSTAHLVLGLFAASSGDSRTAAFHLEHARQLNPQTPLVMNNLAWGLATMTPPQFQRALNVTNAALAAEPANRAMRQTRGQILLRLGRYMEAVQDLDLDMPSDHRHKEVRVAVSEVRERLSVGTRTAAPPETSPAATQAHPSH